MKTKKSNRHHKKPRVKKRRPIVVRLCVAFIKIGAIPVNLLTHYIQSHVSSRSRFAFLYNKIFVRFALGGVLIGFWAVLAAYTCPHWVNHLVWETVLETTKGIGAAPIVEATTEIVRDLAVIAAEEV